MRMGVRYPDLMLSHLQQASLEVKPGTSSFFQERAPELDPRLIMPDGKFNPQIRQHVLGSLYGFWAGKYQNAESWSTVWIAGSAISWQWQGKEIGDLDVLIGVDMAQFRRDNPAWAPFTESQTASRMNQDLREGLTSRVGESVPGFEMTFYVNPGAQDIRSIKPYAAYNLTDDNWTVDPYDIPADWDPMSDMPQAWWDAVRAESERIKYLATEISRLQNELTGDIARDTNTMAAIGGYLNEAQTLWNLVRTERSQAFRVGGGGYDDYWNFRWQAHKLLGTLPVLHQMKSIGELRSDREVASAAQSLKMALAHVHRLG